MSSNPVSASSGPASAPPAIEAADSRQQAIQRVVAETLNGPATTSPAALLGNMSIEAQRELLDRLQANLARDDVEKIRKAIDQGPEAVQALLAEGKIDPSADNNNLIRWASLFSHSAIIRLLLADRRVTPEPYPIAEWACANGADAVLLLLSNPNYVPGHSLMNWSLENNHQPSLALILANPKADPYIREKGKFWLDQASRLGHANLALLLVNDPRIVTQASDVHTAFKLAACNGHLTTVQYLLPKANPGAEESWALRYAGSEEVARLLLADPRVDPTAKYSDCILMASFHGRTGVVKALLQDGRADPTVDMCACLCAAYTHQHNGIVALLLADPRVNPDHHETFDAWAQAPNRPCGAVTERLRIQPD